MCKVFASARVHCIVGLLGNDSDIYDGSSDLSRVHSIQILSVSLVACYDYYYHSKWKPNMNNWNGI